MLASGMFRTVTLPLVILLTSSACRPNVCPEVDDLDDPADVLVIGDSVFDWGSDQCSSVADYLALARGTAVVNNAVNGTRLLDDDAGIPTQLSDGDWSAVVIDGGGNDMNGTCQCGECDELIDDLVSADGTGGAMPDLVARAAEDGAHVILLRYYEMPEGAWYGFDRCGDHFAELGARYEALAAARDDVTLFDARTVMTPDDIDLYDFDRVHPSAAGAATLGAYLAAALDAL